MSPAARSSVAAYVVLVAFMATLRAVWVSPGDELPPRPRGYLAMRDLPVNHRVLEDDLEHWPPEGGDEGGTVPAVQDLVGRYVSSEPLIRGAQVMPTRLRVAPSLSASEGSVLWFLPLESRPALAAHLNAGSRVTLCDTIGCFLDRLEVRAVWCESDAPACSAVLQIPLTRMEPARLKLGASGEAGSFELLVVQ